MGWGAGMQEGGEGSSHHPFHTYRPRDCFLFSIPTYLDLKPPKPQTTPNSISARKIGFKTPTPFLHAHFLLSHALVRAKSRT